MTRLRMPFVRVAVHPVGEAVGVRDTKGILNLVMHEVEVSTLPTNIPERIDADVSNLAIGDVLTVRDLRAPEGVRIINDPGQAVATVSPPMAEEVAATPEATAAVTPAEPGSWARRRPVSCEAAVVQERERTERAPRAADAGRGSRGRRAGLRRHRHGARQGPHPPARQRGRPQRRAVGHRRARY